MLLILVLALGSGQALEELERVPPDRRPSARVRPAIDLGLAPARVLRRLPGLGARRAADLVEARWQRGPADAPLYLTDVPGLGPDVEGQVRAWLEGRPHDR